MSRNVSPVTRTARALVALIVVLVAAAVFAAPAGAHGDDSGKHLVAATAGGVPKDQPRTGLVFGGLRPALPANGCHGHDMFVTKTLGQCTHGPDEAPAGLDVHTATAPTAPSLVTPSFTCAGDGTSGYRVQVLYVHASDVPDRYSQYLASFRQWVADMDSIYSASAAETGGQRQLRFVHDASCTPTIADVTVSPTGDDTFDNTMTEVAAQGWSRTDRKYVMFVDANVYCGIGTFISDDQHDPANSNNFGPSYGRSDNGCWAGEILAHELGHNLGAVQYSAPHTSGGAHCVDEYDVMCYSDFPNYPVMQFLCPDPGHDIRLDCNHDDYYNTDPTPGSYLATHWNVADSVFLVSPQAGSVHGRLTRPDGTPVASARVAVDGLPELNGVTGADGSYRIDGVPNGPIRLTAGPCLVVGHAVTVSGSTTADLVAAAPTDGRYRCDSQPATWLGADTPLTLTGDDALQTVSLPFPVSLYGQTTQQLTISTNGYAMLGTAADQSVVNTTLPSADTPNGALYPFWDDLVVDGNASVRVQTYGSAPNREYVVEWRNVRFFSTGTQRLSFEMVLHEDGTVGFDYHGADPAPLALGSQATIGIENGTGDQAVLVSADRAPLTQDSSVTFQDPRPKLSIGDATVVEGNTGNRALRFTVSLSAPTTRTVSASWLTGAGTATAGGDYGTRTGTLSIPAGSTATTVSVPVTGDTTRESTETFTVRLRGLHGAQAGRTAATGRILDDEGTSGVRVAIGDAAVVEGARGTRALAFTVSLSAPRTSDVTVGYVTGDGTAQAGSDYTATSGTVTIPAGATSVAVRVSVRADTTSEPTEAFTVTLRNPVHVSVGRATGTGRILTDD